MRTITWTLIAVSFASQVALLVLQFSNLIEWEWVWVVSPIWILCVIGFIGIVGAGFLEMVSGKGA